MHALKYSNSSDYIVHGYCAFLIASPLASERFHYLLSLPSYNVDSLAIVFIGKFIFRVMLVPYAIKAACIYIQKYTLCSVVVLIAYILHFLSLCVRTLLPVYSSYARKMYCGRFSWAALMSCIKIVFIDFQLEFTIDMNPCSE